MTEINFREYAPEYRKHLDNTTLKGNTIQKRKLMIDNFIQDHDEEKLTINTDNFYQSVDKIRAYFKKDQVKIYGTRISAIRHFIDYIGTQVDSKTEDKLDDIKEKISMAKLNGKTQNPGTANKKEIEEKLLTDQEIQAAKNAGTKKSALVIDLMMDTGARPGEIVAMTPEDLDFERKSFHINSTWSDAEGEFQDEPKHGSTRRVKISEEVLGRLQNYIEENGFDESDYIFGSYRSDVYRPIKDAYTKAQVRVVDGSTKVTPHWHRHNACTRLIQNGNPKEKVQEYLGHGSIKITERYEHFDDSQVVDVELV